MSEVIGHRAGMPLERFARERLFAPLGIQDYLWLHHRSGSTYGAYGAFFRPRDLAKLGQLVLDGGGWEGRRVVSSQWLTRATARHVHIEASDGTPQVDYGYWWWLNPARGSVYAAGHGGQFVWIHRARAMVVVITAAPDSGDHGASVAVNEMLGLVDAITAGAR